MSPEEKARVKVVCRNAEIIINPFVRPDPSIRKSLKLKSVVKLSKIKCLVKMEKIALVFYKS